MTLQRRLLVACILVAWVGMILACGGAGQTGNRATSPPAQQKAESREASEKPIPYEVLTKKGRSLDGKLMWHILVSETVSKDDVMKLAQNLQREYAGNYAFMFIYDSRETWQRWDDESYPEKERDRHFLVMMDGGITGSKAEIRWCAEGRISPEERKKVEEVAAQKRAEEKAKRQEAAKVEAERKAKEKPEKDEKTTAIKLKLIRDLLDAGRADAKKGNDRGAKDKIETVKLRLEQLIDEFPQTNAAKEAKKLLDSIK